MTLNEYLSIPGSPTKQQLAKLSKVSYKTIKDVSRGMRLKMYSVAKSISDATNGKVTVADLCEEKK